MKFKVGDRVLIAKTSNYYKSGDISNPINTEGEVKNINYCPSFPLLVRWSTYPYDNCYTESDLEFLNKQTNTKMQVNQLMKDAALAQAEKLAKANNTVTTLELKAELRKTDPEFFWDQATVSRLMGEFADDNKFTYTDNGTFRTYSLVGHVPSQPIAPVTTTQTTAATPVSISFPATTIGKSVGRKGSKTISKTKAIEILKNDTKGHFFKAVFTKQKDGKERTINCQLIRNANGEVTTALGIVKVKEASLMKKLKKTGDINTIPSKSVIRSFNINNLKSLVIGGENYKVN